MKITEIVVKSFVVQNHHACDGAVKAAFASIQCEILKKSICKREEMLVLTKKLVSIASVNTTDGEGEIGVFIEAYICGRFPILKSIRTRLSCRSCGRTGRKTATTDVMYLPL